MELNTLENMKHVYQKSVSDIMFNIAILLSHSMGPLAHLVVYGSLRAMVMCASFKKIKVIE